MSDELGGNQEAQKGEIKFALKQSTEPTNYVLKGGEINLFIRIPDNTKLAEAVNKARLCGCRRICDIDYVIEPAGDDD